MLYLIERNFAEQVEMTAAAVDGAKLVIAEEGNDWLYSFLSADRKKMYCLYESPNVRDDPGCSEAARPAGRCDRPGGSDPTQGQRRLVPHPQHLHLEPAVAGLTVKLAGIVDRDEVLLPAVRAVVRLNPGGNRF
jgi:hypothetical protein